MESLVAAGKQRILYIDVARVIAILWIVGYWHLIEYCSEGYGIYSSPRTKFVTKVMLGVFMFLSGYLLGNRHIDSISEIYSFYKGRFFRFYILYAISAILMFGLGLRFSNFNLLTTLTVTSSFILPQPQTLWFMSMLTVFYILTPIVKKSIAFGLGILIMFIVLHYVVPGGIDARIILHFPLYAAGLYMAGSDLLDKVIKNRFVLFLSLALSVALYFGSLKSSLMGYVMIVPGILCVLSISRLSLFKQVRPVISYIAYGSLCAYLFHRHIYFISTNIIENLGIRHPMWVCLLVMLPICLIMSFFIQKTYDMILVKLQK